MIRGPVTHQPQPGDIPRGVSRPYKRFNLQLTRPTLPITVKFRATLPAPNLLIPHGAMGGGIDTIYQKYRGITSAELFPAVVKRKPWE